MSPIKTALQKAIQEAIEGDPKFIATLEIQNEPEKWIQVSWDQFHFAYPITAEPIQLFQGSGGILPAFVELSGWVPNESATFSHGAEPIDDLAYFAERFFNLVIGDAAANQLVAISDEA